MSTTTISPDMTMAEILDRIPSAQRALFQRYHVGGCSSCAFQPTDTLAQVCKDHNILDVNEVVQYLERAGEVDAKMMLDPKLVKSWIDAGESFRFIDVREPHEIELARVKEAEALDYTHSQQYMELPKDTKIVFICKNGARSLDVGAYFVGHKFENVFAVRGGVDAWREDVDPSLPVYEVEG
ncbi:MAG: rhodanese-like domain-containing protein [Planctomycetota bacterium]